MLLEPFHGRCLGKLGIGLMFVVLMLDFKCVGMRM